MSKDQIVRDTAYAIWEAEGRPEGRAREHWAQAEERVAASLKAKPAAGSAATGKPASAGAKAKPPAKGTPPAASATARPTKPAKAAATKAAPAKKS